MGGEEPCLLLSCLCSCGFVSFSLLCNDHIGDPGAVVIWVYILGLVFASLRFCRWALSLGKLMEQVDRGLQLVERCGLCLREGRWVLIDDGMDLNLFIFWDRLIWVFLGLHLDARCLYFCRDACNVSR